MTKKLTALALALILALSMTAVGYAEEDQVTINLWHRWSSGTEAALMDVIAGFEAANPNIHVEVTAKSGEYFALLQSIDVYKRQRLRRDIFLR